MNISLNTSKINRQGPEDFYPIRGNLTFRKLMGFLPAMFATNISALLLITVDGLVAGNLVGDKALSSISILEPAVILVGAMTVIFSSGASAVLSVRMGDADTEGILRAKKATKFVSIAAAIVLSIIQIPLVMLIINSYDLSGEMRSLVISYAIGIMISNPFGLISTISTYEIQIMGRMKMLMGLSIVEGVTNLVLDIVFMGPCNMGVAGAGYGTACACIVRCLLSVYFLHNKTDIYKTGDTKASATDIREIVQRGLPEGVYQLIVACQSYFFIQILFMYFGDDGGTIKAVCAFCYSLINVLMSSVQGCMRPLMGLMSGAKNRQGTRKLMKQGMILVFILSGIMIILVEALPEQFYRLHGIMEIPEGGVESLRIYALCIGVLGLNAIFRLYFSNSDLHRFSSILTLAGNSTMPVFAYALGIVFPAPVVWLAYLLSASLIFFVSFAKYMAYIKKEKMKEKDIESLYMSVKPEKAIEASKMIQQYAQDNGYSLKLANRARLCMEEMVAYSVEASGRVEVENQIMISFSESEVVFMMIDDGRCIVFDEDREKQRMITDNYALLKKLAASVQYQYVLNLNYTIIKFVTDASLISDAGSDTGAASD